jgi:hypothetical protein
MFLLLQLQLKLKKVMMKVRSEARKYCVLSDENTVVGRYSEARHQNR